MRRILSVLLVLFMAVMLAACAGSGRTSPATFDENVENTPTANTESTTTLEESVTTDQDDLAETAPPEEEVLAGIIIGARRHSEIDIYCVNPENGEMQQLFTISVATQQDGTSYTWRASDRYASQHGMVSSDLSKVATTKWHKDQAEFHAGWIDRDGNFFDVTEALGLVPTSDFEARPQQYGIGFSENNEFIFLDFNTDEYYRVSCDSLTKENIITGREMPACMETMGYLVSRWTDRDYMPTDIIDDTRFLADYYNASGSYTDSVIVDATTKEATKYVAGDARHIWSGTLSPDGQQIAFLSALRNVLNTPTDLYITPLAGDEPVKVEVDLPDSLNDRGRVEVDPLMSGTYVFIIDWLE